MNKLPAIIIASGAMAAAFAGCNSAGCTDNQNSLPYAGFYAWPGGEAISVNSLEVTGIGAPDGEPLYSAGESLANIYLPLRSEQNVTSYCFHYDQNGIDNDLYNDTLTFRYSSQPYFASEECGAMLTYRIESLTYTRHLIESITITDSLITNTDLERIKIYFRTEQ